ncbi:MAG TPA: SDR family NAD(P)-dependent oxidoreductase [Anaerolineae bacterium]|nr:SDR family NAD(P)-dependent oxidoreductase [Anaerolineae bacterium]
MAGQKWTANDIPDQSDKVIIVTGANSGLGYETSLALARKGAHVVLACRNRQKGETAVTQIRQQVPDASLELMALDLADLSSIRQFAAEFQANHDRLDVLINNAGIMAIPYRQTADGFEMQFGVNHLGHFALTGRLLDLLTQTANSRVVTVSSNMHWRGKIDFDNLNGERDYSKWGAYSASKLANLLFAYELQRRLAAAGYDTSSVAAHPGYAATDLQAKTGSRLQTMVMRFSNAVFAQSAARGALPTLYAAVMPNARGGGYYGPGGLGEMRGHPVKVQSSGASHDGAAAVKLWQVSEQLTGVAYLDNL